MSVQWPLVKARLVALAPSLAGWSTLTVFDGPAIAEQDVPVDADTQRSGYVTIGYTTDDESGSFSTEQSPDGYQYIERGTVPGEIVVQVGDEDAAALAGLEAVLFAALNGLDAAIRADRRLGVLSQEGTSALTVTTTPVLGDSGLEMLARFALAYFTVT